MKYDDYGDLISLDLHRYNPEEDRFLKCLLSIPGFKYTFCLRTAKYFADKKGIIPFLSYVMARIFLNKYTFKYGINLPFRTQIEPGFYIGHFGGIVVSPEAIIGKNCNINNDVTIGVTYGGKYPGAPVIKDNVYLGPGSKIIGGIEIGNNVAIGANSVVTESIPDY